MLVCRGAGIVVFPNHRLTFPSPPGMTGQELVARTGATPAYADSPGEYKISFASGPYKSMEDTRLARSTISECPPPNPADEKE